MRAMPILFAILAATVSSAHAANIDQLQNLSQDEFNRLSKDLTAGLSYKPIAPAASLGVTGFDLGVALSGVRMRESDLWNKATGTDLKYMPVPKLSFVKGLPFGIDIGGSYIKVPGSNISCWGGELKYAILEGGALTPALAVRGAYTRLNGVDQLDFSTRSLDVSVSKGFIGLTPYIGIGEVWGSAKPNLPASFPLHSVNQTETKAFAGVNINLGIGNLAFEYDRTGGNDTLSTKLGIRW